MRDDQESAEISEQPGRVIIGRFVQLGAFVAAQFSGFLGRPGNRYTAIGRQIPERPSAGVAEQAPDQEFDNVALAGFVGAVDEREIFAGPVDRLLERSTGIDLDSCDLDAHDAASVR